MALPTRTVLARAARRESAEVEVEEEDDEEDDEDEDEEEEEEVWRRERWFGSLRGRVLEKAVWVERKANCGRTHRREGDAMAKSNCRHNVATESAMDDWLEAWFGR